MPRERNRAPTLNHPVVPPRRDDGSQRLPGIARDGLRPEPHPRFPSKRPSALSSPRHPPRSEPQHRPGCGAFRVTARCPCRSKGPGRQLLRPQAEARFRFSVARRGSVARTPRRSSRLAALEAEDWRRAQGAIPPPIHHASRTLELGHGPGRAEDLDAVRGGGGRQHIGCQLVERRDVLDELLERCWC